MAPTSGVRPIGLRLTRRGKATLLAAASVVTAPSVPDTLFSLTATLFQLNVAGLIAYEAVLGTGVLGIQLSWLFLGYLVYAYLPEIYLDRYEPFTSDRGVRVLTAGLALYIGIGTSVMTGVIEPQVAAGVVPGNFEGQLWYLIGGLFGGVLSFGGYLSATHHGELTDPDGDLVVLIAPHREGRETVRRILNQFSSYRLSTRAFIIAIIGCFSPAALVFASVLMGLGLGALSLFYPVPEVMLFGGLLLGEVSKHTDRLPAIEGQDIELRFLDEMTDALKNLKGYWLMAFCVFGALVSSVAFLLAGVVIPIVLETAGALAGAVGRGAAPGSNEVLKAVALGWLLVGIVVLLLVVGLYGLFYWYRQLRRLPQYATFWAAQWHDTGQQRPEPAVSRPPGLLLPATLAFGLFWSVMFLASSWSASWTTATWLGVFVVGLAWPVVVGWAVRSAKRTAQIEPQPFDHEGRDVLIAFLPSSAMLLLGALKLQDGLTPSAWLAIGLILLALALLGYSPEVGAWSSDRGGRARLVDFGLFTVVLGAGMAAADLLYGIPGPVVALVVGLLVVLGLTLYLEETMV